MSNRGFEELIHQAKNSIETVSEREICSEVLSKNGEKICDIIAKISEIDGEKIVTDIFLKSREGKKIDVLSLLPVSQKIQVRLGEGMGGYVPPDTHCEYGVVSISRIDDALSIQILLHEIGHAQQFEDDVLKEIMKYHDGFQYSSDLISIGLIKKAGKLASLIEVPGISESMVHALQTFGEKAIELETASCDIRSRMRKSFDALSAERKKIFHRALEKRVLDASLIMDANLATKGAAATEGDYELTRYTDIVFEGLPYGQNEYLEIDDVAEKKRRVLSHVLRHWKNVRDADVFVQDGKTILEFFYSDNDGEDRIRLVLPEDVLTYEQSREYLVAVQEDENALNARRANDEKIRLLKEEFTASILEMEGDKSTTRKKIDVLLDAPVTILERDANTRSIQALEDLKEIAGIDLLQPLKVSEARKRELHNASKKVRFAPSVSIDDIDTIRSFVSDFCLVSHGATIQDGARAL